MTPGKKFRAALKEERPLQVIGAICAYHALIARRSGYKALYLSGGGVAAGSLGMPDPSIGEITLSLTPAETRQFPVGRLRARYEIERRIEGEETTLVSGCIAVMDGINDDSGDH